jgi:DNA modification methylase
VTAPTDLLLEHLPIDDLHPDPANPRRIADAELDALTRSMATFGAVQPILVRREDGVVIGGHQRLVAARRLGWTTVPVIRLDMTADEAHLLNLALNRISGDWDERLLARLLEDLRDTPDVDLSLSGFGEDEVADLLRRMAAAEKADRAEDFDVEAAVEQARAEPKSRRGDLWLLGEHRVLCGDATDRADVERLLDGSRPALLVTDPPYGVGYDPGWRNEVADGRGVVRSRRLGKVTNDDRADWTEAWQLAPCSVAYVWHGGLHAGTVAESLARAGFEVRSQLIWVKPKMVFGRGAYHWRHEPCWYAVREGASADWAGDRSQTTVWEIDHLAFRSTATTDDPWTEHATQKPLEAMARPIRNHAGDVYDPFAGSGTTLIATDKLGRRSWSMELDPVYVDVIVARWEAFTGGTAVLAERLDAAA